jgi:hypothetical protein
MALTPLERSMRGRIAVTTSWANTPDPSARTQPARDKFDATFEKQVIELAAKRGEVLSPDEIRRRAGYLRSAHFQRLAYKSARARKKRAGSDG